MWTDIQRTRTWWFYISELSTEYTLIDGELFRLSIGRDLTDLGDWSPARSLTLSISFDEKWLPSSLRLQRHTLD